MRPRWWWGRGRRERDLAEELASHFRLAVADRMAQGMTRAEAEAAARREFGSDVLVAEVTRGMWAGARLWQLGREARLTLRALRRNPRFSVAAVLCIAAGVGVTMTIVSALYAVLLRPLPYPHADELVAIRARHVERGATGATITHEALEAWQSARTLSDIGTWRSGERALTGGEDVPARVQSALVSPNLMALLGVAPALGRWFTEAEAVAGRDEVVVLSEALWRTRFGGDAGLVGRTIEVNGRAVTVAGVMPAGFSFPDGALLWEPLVPPLDIPRDVLYYDGVLGRLAAGADAARAREEFAALTTRIAAGYAGWQFELLPLREYLVGALRRPILLFQAAAALVLLLACANVAALLLARSASRRSELAVRAALGAGGGRLALHVLLECTLLVLIGGVLGVAVAWSGVRLLALAFPEGVPSYIDLRLHTPVLLGALALVLVTALAVGAAPALNAARARANALLAGMRNASGTAVRSGGRNVLVAAEVAVSVVLLAAAVLLVRTHAALERSLGFEPGGVLTVRVQLPLQRYTDPERRTAFFAQLDRRIRELPQVERVSASTSSAPLDDGISSGRWGFRIDDQTAAAPDQLAASHMIAPGYVAALGVPIVQGRDVSDDDARTGAYTALVNESFAARFLPDGAVGRRIVLERAPGRATPPLRVVGVVRDFRHEPPPALLAPTIYMLQPPDAPTRNYVIQASLADPAVLVPAIRATVRELDPSLVVSRIQTQRRLVQRAFWRQILQRNVFTVFAALAMLLAVLGMYGVLSYAVAQRTSELGVRLALGAAPWRLLALVVVQALRVAAAGILVGSLATLAFGRLLEGMLYDVDAADPTVIGGVAMALLVTAVVAALLPAVRAARLDPQTAMRT